MIILLHRLDKILAVRKISSRKQNGKYPTLFSYEILKSNVIKNKI